MSRPLSNPAERIARWLVASALLFWLAGPYWPEVVDDLYISAAYAHEWIDHGRLQWTTGEVVEGYSNFLMVAIMALIAVAGGDVGLGSQVVSMVASVATLGLLSRWLPTGRGGTTALLAVAAWAPLQWWAAQGMETPVYALLLSVAWVGALRGGSAWSLGVLFAALASLTRPEGAAHLLGVLLVGWVMERPRRPQLWFAAAVLLALAGYHAARIAWFGEVLPTSVVVKVQGTRPTVHGVLQLAGDLVCFAGVALAWAASVRLPRSRALVVAMLPALAQAAVLVRASGDWMVWSRLTMPGLVASLAVLATLAASRPLTATRAAVASAGVLLSLTLTPRGFGTLDVQPRSLPTPGEALAGYTKGLYTPIAEDITWAAWHLHEDAALLAVDAGLIGNMPGLRFIDLRGLTHRPAAEAIGSGTERTWFLETISPPTPSVDWVRLANWESADAPDAPPEMLAAFEHAATIEYPQGGTWWYASTAERGNATLAADRLLFLHERYPSQPYLAHQAAIALSAAGRMAEAAEVASAAGERWPERTELVDAPASLSFVGGTAPRSWHHGRGFGIYWNAGLTSRPITIDELESGTLHLDQDPVGDTAARAEVTLQGACSSTSEVSVAGPTAIGLAELPCPIERPEQPLEVVVKFLNDEVVGGQDRNLYVWLEGGTTPER